MSKKHAIIVAVENYQDSQIHSVHYAENDARALAGALEQHGFEQSNRTSLLSSEATKARLESLLRTRFGSLEEDDQLIVFYAGHGFADAGKNYITCHDTVLTDLTATSIELQTLFSAIRNSMCRSVVLLLDCCHSGLPIDQCMRGLISDMTDDEFENFCKESDYHIAFASSATDEVSYSSDKLKHGIWSYHVIEAFNGERKEALQRDRFLTISSLQNFLSLEVPRTLRHTLTGNRVQTPRYWGSVSREAMLVDFTEIFAKREIASKSLLADMKRASLFGHELGSVRSLSGFNKRFHHVPDSVTDSTRGFVRKIGHEEVTTTSEELFAKIRENFKYKRREIDLDEDEGSASIMTPDFTVNITIDIDNENPSGYVLAVEVTDIRNYSALSSDEFDTVFDRVFDRVVFELSDHVDLEEIVDKIEDLGDEELISVDYPIDLSFCEVKINGLDGVLRIESCQLVFVRSRKEGVGALLQGCRELPTLLSGHGIMGLLPESEE